MLAADMTRGEVPDEQGRGGADPAAYCVPTKAVAQRLITSYPNWPEYEPSVRVAFLLDIGQWFLESGEFNEAEVWLGRARKEPFFVTGSGRRSLQVRLVNLESRSFVARGMSEKSIGQLSDYLSKNPGLPIETRLALLSGISFGSIKPATMRSLELVQLNELLQKQFQLWKDGNAETKKVLQTLARYAALGLPNQELDAMAEIMIRTSRDNEYLRDDLIGLMQSMSIGHIKQMTDEAGVAGFAGKEHQAFAEEQLDAVIKFCRQEDADEAIEAIMARFTLAELVNEPEQTISLLQHALDDARNYAARFAASPSLPNEFQLLKTHLACGIKLHRFAIQKSTSSQREQISVDWQDIKS